MTRGITVALMGLFLLTAPAYAASDTVSTHTGSSKASKVISVTNTLKVTLTGYNAVPGQTDGDPSTTASGAYSNPEIVAARSRDLASELPFGTVIDIEPSSATPGCGLSLVDDKIGLRVIADTMAARMHNKVDVLFGANDTVDVGGRLVNAARALGNCRVTVRVVGHVDIASIPTTQTKLAAAISDRNLAVDK